MHISRMLILITAVLILGGVFKRSLREARSEKLEALFFLLCIAVLDRFILEPAEGIRISPACVFMLSVSVIKRFSGRKRLSVLNFVLIPALGISAAPLLAVGGEWACYAAGAIAASAALYSDILSSLEIASAASVTAFAVAQIYSGLRFGMTEIELADTCLAVQLSAVITVLFIKELNAYSTSVRILSYKRPSD